MGFEDLLNNRIKELEFQISEKETYIEYLQKDQKDWATSCDDLKTALFKKEKQYDQIKAGQDMWDVERGELKYQIQELNDRLDFCKQNHHNAEYVEREVTQGKPISDELKNAVKLYLSLVGEVYRKDLVQHDFCAGWMAKESISIVSSEIIEKEIRRAFIHGQGNAEMMEAGLERDEVDDYVNFRMLSLDKQSKTENERLREENSDLMHRLQATEDMRKMQEGNAEYWKKMYDEAVLALTKK